MKTLVTLFVGLVLVSSPFAQPSKTAAAPGTPAAPTAVELAKPGPPLSATSLAKLATMKPLFDGRTLDRWIQAPVAPLRFAREDVKDLAALTRRMTNKSDALAAWLSEQFDADGMAALAITAPTTAQARDVTTVLLRNLNRIAGSDASIFDAARFKGVTLRAETVALREESPRGIDLARLNRLLLEDAFPQILAKSPAAAWIVKDGAMASTGAGRGVIYTKDDYAHYRLLFQIRQISGNHVPGVLVFCARPPAGELGADALAAVQFQVPNGGHWDYRPGVNAAGTHFTRPVRLRFDLKAWAQVEILVNSKTGVGRMAVAQPVGTRATEILVFNDPAAGRPGPIAWQMHNAGLFDEFRDVRIEIDPKEERLITVE